MDLDVNGIRLFVDIDESEPKEKPILVCLHGSYLDHTYLKYSLSPLRDRYKLVYLDFRGSGRSEHGSPQQWHTRQLAEDVATLLDILELDRVFLLCHSWGCHVAVRPALSQSERIIGNLLFNPGLVDFPCFYRNLERSCGNRARELASAIYENKDLRGFSEYIDLLFPQFFQRPPDAALLGNAVTSEAFFAESIDELRGVDWWGEIRKLPMDTLICNGRHDLYTKDSLSDDMRDSLNELAVRHIRVETFAHSGHFILNDESDKAFDMIDDFVTARSDR